MDKDNKNILLCRKIILLSLGLITCLRWCRVDIEKAIIRILEACEFKLRKAMHTYWAGFSLVTIAIKTIE